RSPTEAIVRTLPRKPPPPGYHPDTSQSAWAFFSLPVSTPQPVPTVLTYNVGTKINMDLWVNSGNSDNNITASQNYLSFTLSVLQMVSATAASCVLTSVVVPDLAVFDAVLQNETCNGPSPCTF